MCRSFRVGNATEGRRYLHRLDEEATTERREEDRKARLSWFRRKVRRTLGKEEGTIDIEERHPVA